MRSFIATSAAAISLALFACSESPSANDPGANRSGAAGALGSGGTSGAGAGGSAGSGGLSGSVAMSGQGGLLAGNGGTVSGAAGDGAGGAAGTSSAGMANAGSDDGGVSGAAGSDSGGAGLGGASGAGGAGPRPTVTAAPGTTLVKVDTTVLHQTFEGWGTSLAWWANHVGGWSADGRNAVVDAVVDPVNGLGYNVFRYNIGGGENPAHDHMGMYRDMPGFLASNGTWDWGADANQRAILLSIVERGQDLVLEAFSNSPPYWMTKSGCASGSSDGSNNLKDDSYDAFADYLTEVALHYRDTYGITFRTLEPLNEPNANWWTANGGQEGCHFSPSSQATLIRAVASSLAAKGLSETTVSAADENSIDDAVNNLRGFDATTLSAMTQINVHSYSGSRRAELKTFATNQDKILWQSESGPLNQTLADETAAALFMAGRIILDLRELEPHAWVDWQSGDPSRNWASFTLNDSRETFTPVKRFYMHAGFSRFIRPGATFVDIDNDDMVAAISNDGKMVAIVARNGDMASDQSFTFDLTSLSTVGASVEAHRTSRSEDLESLPAIAIDGYSFVATVPAYSLTTFVVPMP